MRFTSYLYWLIATSLLSTTISSSPTADSLNLIRAPDQVSDTGTSDESWNDTSDDSSDTLSDDSNSPGPENSPPGPDPSWYIRLTMDNPFPESIRYRPGIPPGIEPINPHFPSIFNIAENIENYLNTHHVDFTRSTRLAFGANRPWLPPGNPPRRLVTELNIYPWNRIEPYPTNDLVEVRPYTFRIGQYISRRLQSTTMVAAGLRTGFQGALSDANSNYWIWYNTFHLPRPDDADADATPSPPDLPPLNQTPGVADLWPPGMAPPQTPAQANQNVTQVVRTNQTPPADNNTAKVGSTDALIEEFDMHVRTESFAPLEELQNEAQLVATAALFGIFLAWTAL